ncbi:MAG: hypothetical protein A2475_03070 [Ignavibacteria bacterium RIFOXYC2_FULL_35_21]|nr:MAG: hypothetical protein A2220_03885 [Ignavibacteria bacterium RIFOXYA2_FULL_35_10]OGV23635.1 MAG: hypothetical protein A2475_03070 [Ignavibacteria bacterium RIFOXYC2_FULL_35_21]
MHLIRIRFSIILVIILSFLYITFGKNESKEIKLSNYIKLLTNQDDIKFIKEILSSKDIDSIVINRINNKNKRIGTWLTNDEFGNLKYIEKYGEETNKYAKVGQFLYRDEKITIYNNTPLKIQLLFDQFYEKFGKVRFNESLWFFKACNDSNLVFSFEPNLNFVVKNDTVENILNYKCSTELKGIRGTNPGFNSKSGKIIIRKQKLITSFGKVTVTSYGSFCEDTGYNLVELETRGGKLTFSGMRNVSIYEADANKDGKNELYVLTHQNCAQMLRIYRVGI